MFTILLYIDVFSVYFACPLPGRLLIFAINFFVPDHIPVIDEAIMFAGIITKLNIIGAICEFISEHWKTIVAVGIILAILAIILL